MKKIKKQIPLKLEMEYFEKLAEHQANMGGVSMTQAIKNLIMNRSTQSKASNHLLALCGMSNAVIANLEVIIKSTFTKEEKMASLKELRSYSHKINRILRRYKY